MMGGAVGGGVNRRTAIQSGGAALLGFGLGGCAARGTAEMSAGRPRITLAPIKASWDRVIRTTVGLRPHRPTGFNLSAAKLDAKTVIHNYGHGGSGHSLGWGTGSMAADLAVAHESRRAAVIGCGTVGLTAARQLQRRGFDVTIYAASLPPDTTSNKAYAGFTPTSGLISAEFSPDWEAQFRTAVEIAYRQLQLLVGSRYGVSWIDSYNTSDLPPGQGPASQNPAQANAGDLLPPGVQQTSGREVLGPGEHPFPAKYATRRQSIRIEPSIYLDALLQDFVAFGGRVVVRTFDTPRDLMALSEPIIVNCSGLGSRTLFGDETMMPVKGQLVLLVPQPEVTYSCRAMPRSDGIALGSTQERGVWSMEPNEEERTRVMENCIKFYAAMRAVPPGQTLSESTPPRRAPAVEDFFGEES
jgi:glycine/D-amino acid oxidase-like deaminating enzyme